MSYYIIEGNGDSPDIPFQELTSLSELSAADALVLRCDFSGTDDHPVTILDANGGYMKTYTFGGVKSMRTKEMQSSTTHGLSYMSDYAVVVAYSVPDGSDGYYHRVLWKPSDSNSATRAVTDIKNGRWSSDNVLYNVIGADEAIPGFVVVNREWDEAPTTDRDDLENVLPRGGEYADTDGYWESDIVDINDFNNIDQDTSLLFDYSSFIKHYVLSEINMRDIGDNFFLPGFWTSLNNKFQGLSDPMSFIISAVELPFGYSDTPTTFHLGGVTLLNPNDTGIACYETKKRYINFGAGSRTIKEVWGSARDYSDIQVQLFLPYCGVKELDPDLIVNHTVTLACNVDMLTGDLVWLVQTSNAGLSGTYFQQQTIPYRFTGNCGKQVPLGRFDNSSAILGMMGMLAGSVVGGVGAAAGAVGPAVAVGEGTAAMGAGASISGAASAASGATNFLANGMNARANTSSGVSGSFGSMDVKYPYLVIKRSVPKYPNGWRAEFGAPRYQKFSGTDLHGYTQFSDIHIDLPQGASDSERAELERLLKTEGVIL